MWDTLLHVCAMIVTNLDQAAFGRYTVKLSYLVGMYYYQKCYITAAQNKNIEREYILRPLKTL